MLNSSSREPIRNQNENFSDALPNVFDVCGPIDADCPRCGFSELGVCWNSATACFERSVFLGDGNHVVGMWVVCQSLI